MNRRRAEVDADHTAVLVGAGQLTQREAEPEQALSPPELMAEAARDSGAGPAPPREDRLPGRGGHAELAGLEPRPTGRGGPRRPTARKQRLREPPRTDAAGDDLPALRERLPRPPGPATIETYTVVFGRAWSPERGIVVGHLEDDRRFLASTPARSGPCRGTRRHRSNRPPRHRLALRRGQLVRPSDHRRGSLPSRATASAPLERSPLGTRRSKTEKVFSFDKLQRISQVIETIHTSFWPRTCTQSPRKEGGHLCVRLP